MFFAKREGTFCECASSRRLMVLPLAEFIHADFVSLASEHPPIDVPYAELGIRDIIPSI